MLMAAHLSTAVLLCFVEGMSRERAPLKAEYTSTGGLCEVPVATCWAVARCCMGRGRVTLVEEVCEGDECCGRRCVRSVAYYHAFCGFEMMEMEM